MFYACLCVPPTLSGAWQPGVHMVHVHVQFKTSKTGIFRGVKIDSVDSKKGWRIIVHSQFLAPR